MWPTSKVTLGPSPASPSLRTVRLCHTRETSFFLDSSKLPITHCMQAIVGVNNNMAEFNISCV